MESTYSVVNLSVPLHIDNLPLHPCSIGRLFFAITRFVPGPARREISCSFAGFAVTVPELSLKTRPHKVALLCSVSAPRPSPRPPVAAPPRSADGKLFTMAHMPLSLISRLIPAIDGPPRQRTVIDSLNRCLGCAEDLPGLRRKTVHSSIPLGFRCGSLIPAYRQDPGFLRKRRNASRFLRVGREPTGTWLARQEVNTRSSSDFKRRVDVSGRPYL